jgi:hypothetical protein
MATCEHVITRSGLRAVRLENERMSVSLLPEAGGKIAELIDRRSGRNWLWQNQHLPIRRPVYGSDYGRELDCTTSPAFNYASAAIVLMLVALYATWW